MSSGDERGPFLYNLPPAVLWEFCRIMDGLSDRDWTRFASEVLCDQTAVRLAEKKERRTDWVMNQWENRKGLVVELIDLLERLQLLRPRDVILDWASGLKPSSPPRVSDPPPKQPEAPPILPLATPISHEATPTPSTRRLSTTVDEGGGTPLPKPAPPPPNLRSDLHQRPPVVEQSSSGVMCWSYEEVHAGTAGFSPSRQVGEGGFGVVYRATLRNTDCAVKRLKQDSVLDWTLLKESFQTEVDQLSKFRHPNIVDLLGISEGRGSMCLIYSYMEQGSLQDQLHNECESLSWSQRLGVVKGASAALQFLHSPPDGHKSLIHGDVKSSNILLDRHLVAKLADFGLARSVARGGLSGHSASQTASLGKTSTVRGTLAYLPEEYLRNRQLRTTLDVYSFGVVLLEVLTGRRALETDRKSGDRYLKDLVKEVEEDSPSGSCAAAAWRKQLDHRLTSGGAAEPALCMDLVSLACRCLDNNRKKTPSMAEVFDKLQDIHVTVTKTSSSSSALHHLPPSLPLPHPPRPLDSSVGALSEQLSKLGPLEDTYQPSSFSSLTPPHPLHSSSSLPPSSSPLLSGPCETDESRGFSQYSSNGTSSRDQYHSPSVPTEDQYHFPPQPSSTRDRLGAGALTGAPPGPDPAESLSPVGSLQSLGPSVNQRFLQKKTPELRSSDHLYVGRSFSVRRPEESDELDSLPDEH